MFVFIATVLAGVDDIAYIYMLPERVMIHLDLFNFGIIGGKIMRAALSLYFNGFIFYSNSISFLSQMLALIIR